MSKLIEQASEEKLQRQQQILAHLGFYKGRIDGIWGPKTIDAKRQFESAGFAPGIPNGGLPFQAKGPYPKGLFMQSGLLMCAGFNPDNTSVVQNAAKVKRVTSATIIHTDAGADADAVEKE